MKKKCSFYRMKDMDIETYVPMERDNQEFQEIFKIMPNNAQDFLSILNKLSINFIPTMFVIYTKIMTTT